MSVSYSTGTKPRKPRQPRMLTPEARAEKDRLCRLPHYMHASKDYPEEFWIDADHQPARCYDIRVEKGHSPHTGTKYTYAVMIYVEDADNPRFAPVAIHRVDSSPKRWVNQMGEGVIPPSADGLRPVWDTEGRPRSERLNSIIAKAKVKLAEMLKRN